MIGYYVHHHGSGHLARALAIASQLGNDVTLLGSLGPSSGVPAGYVELERDDLPTPAGDVVANGALHWAPTNHGGLRRRSWRLAQWLADPGSRLLVSDVSVEALLLARLMSVAPVAVAQRGVRVDRAHANGYDAAVSILAPWVQETQHDWPAEWLAKTTWTGMISRFDERPRADVPCDRVGTCVVLMLGRGGHDLTDAALTEAAAVAGAHWHLLGASGLAVRLPEESDAQLDVCGDVNDPWPYLCSADVVVAAAGNSAIADVAAARAPLVAIAQPRPFDEQIEQVRVLARHGLCATALRWPTRSEWPSLLGRAREIGGEGWKEHSDGMGARRAAAALRSLVDEYAPEHHHA